MGNTTSDDGFRNVPSESNFFIVNKIKLKKHSAP